MKKLTQQKVTFESTPFDIATVKPILTARDKPCLNLILLPNCMRIGACN